MVDADTYGGAIAHANVRGRHRLLRGGCAPSPSNWSSGRLAMLSGRSSDKQ
jgi:hypothetical protein